MQIIYFLGLWNCPSLHWFTNNDNKTKQNKTKENRRKKKKEKAASSLECMSSCCFALDTLCSIPSNTLAIWLKNKDFEISFCYLECYSWASLINQGQTLWSDSFYKKDPNKKLVSNSMRNTPIRALKHTGSFDPLDFWSQLQIISKITRAQVGYN